MIGPLRASEAYTVTVAGYPADLEAPTVRMTDADGVDVTIVVPATITETVDGYEVAWNAPALDGTYVLSFEPNLEGEEITPITLAVVSWRPVLEEVAAQLRVRTYEDGTGDLAGSDLAGTFTADTRPTASEAEQLIDQASEDVLSHFTSGEIPLGSYASARRAATLRAAHLIELSYFPEQQEDSPYLQLRALAEGAMSNLIAVAQIRDLFGELADGT